MLTDSEIQRRVDDGTLRLAPFEGNSLQPASYDLRVGDSAFASTTKQKIDLKQRGVVVIEPGEFIVVETLETVGLDRQTAGQLGLRSEYARKGLLMLSGPHIDPGFRGVLVVRLLNLSPHTAASPHNSPFLTAQFFRLAEPTAKPYEGPRQ